MKAVFDRRFVKNLDGTYVKSAAGLRDRLDAIKADIADFKKRNNLDRCVMIWCGSTEVHMKPMEIHGSIDSLQRAIDGNDPNIPPSMLYALAALESGVPFVNGAPNLTLDVPAMIELAALAGVPITGKDFKTGQTLMKTILAPGLKSRMLGLEGWYSTNILETGTAWSWTTPNRSKPRRKASSPFSSTYCSPTSTRPSTRITTTR